MPRLRLTGLFLFITTICIGLASAATHTTHIRFKRSDAVVAKEQGAESSELAPEEIQFMSVPIIYPLSGVGLLSLLLWFAPAGERKKRTPARSRRSRSKKTPWAFGNKGRRK